MTRETPKAFGCLHYSQNGGYTCVDLASSYRCPNCLRQEIDRLRLERDEARAVARELCHLGRKPPFPPHYQHLPWLIEETP